MAMMKYGRTTKTSTPPDKSNGNAPKQGRITEEQYLAREKEREDWAKRKSLSDQKMKEYQEELKLYKQGVKINPGTGKSLGPSKDQSGRDITFSGAVSLPSAESVNKELEAKLKSGEVVRWNDPSIDATTRKLILGSMGGSVGARDLQGKPDEYYLPKGTKYSSYKDLYGFDFNPEEWNAEEKKGPESFSNYLKSKGYTGRSFVPKTGVYTHYKSPTSPEPFNEAEPEKMDMRFVDLKMPKLSTPKLDNPALKKSLAGVSSKPTDMKEPTPEEEWNAPTPKGTRSALKLDVSRQGGQGGKWGLRKKIASDGSGKLSPAIRFNEETQTYTRPKGLRYKREEKLAKAFYSPVNERGRGGYYAKGDEGVVQAKGGSYGEYIGSRKQMKQEVKDLRSERRSYRKGSTEGSDKKSEMKGFREDIKTARLAKAYARKGRLTPEGDETWQEGEKSRLRYFTPDTNKNKEAGAMSKYVKAAKSHIEKAGEWQKYATVNEENAKITKGSKSKGYSEKSEKGKDKSKEIKARASQFKGWDKQIK